MKVLLLNGEIIEFPNDPNDSSKHHQTISKHLNIHPLQLRLIKPTNFNEDTYWAFISPKPVVQLSEYKIVNDFHNISYESYDSYDFEWLRTCVNESVLTYFLKLRPCSKHLYRNPHPLVVEAILDHFDKNKESTIVELNKNPSDRVVDFLLAHPQWIRLSTIRHNLNPRAIRYVYNEYILNILNTIHERDLIKCLCCILIHPNVEEDMVDHAFTELIKLRHGVIKLVKLLNDTTNYTNINKYILPKLMRQNSHQTFQEVFRHFQFHQRDYRQICQSISDKLETLTQVSNVSKVSKDTCCPNYFDVLDNVSRLATISDSDEVMDFILSKPVLDVWLKSHEYTGSVVKLFSNPHPKAVEWAIANYDRIGDVDTYHRQYRTLIHNNPHPDAVDFALSLLSQVKPKDGYFQHTNNYNPKYVMGVLESGMMECLRWSDVCRMLSQTEDFVVSFDTLKL